MLGGEPSSMDSPEPRGARERPLCAAFFAMPSSSLAGEPPNQSDPCSRAGRDICGTLGVGFYSQSRYGIRWFGDFRRAVPGEAHTFCLDLRYWYASRDYRYREHRGLPSATATARPCRSRGSRSWPTRSGPSVARRTPTGRLPSACYVHAMMGDARPGEVDPAGARPARRRRLPADRTRRRALPRPLPHRRSLRRHVRRG